MKSKKTNATARALVYAVTYINLRIADDDESDDDVGALESIAAIIANCNESELDQLSHAAKEAYNEERRSANPREEFLEDYGNWMESICGEDWEGNDRQVD